MSIIEELRTMLDDRGIKWDEIVDNENLMIGTRWKDSEGYFVTAFAYVDCQHIKTFTDFFWQPTPKQAIEATFGRETCRDKRKGTIAFKCSECGCWLAYDDDWSTGIYAWVGDDMRSIFPHYCPNCGRKVVDQ